MCTTSMALALAPLLAAPAARVRVRAEAPGAVFMKGEAIRFRVDPAAREALSYRVMDFGGREAARGAIPRGGTEVRCAELSRGWYELVLAGRDPVPFGVIGRRPDAPPPDGPIAVDGAIAWLAREDQWPAVARMLRRAGIGWIRERLSFAGVAPRRGTWNWGKYEKVAEALASQGIRIDPIFHDTPGWTHPGDGRTRNPEDLRDVYAFAKAAGGHFRGRVRAWEPWNEPDIFFWPDLGDTFAGVQKAAYLGFKAADPETPVLLAAFCRGVCPFDDNILESGIADYFDIFNYHIYAKPERYPAQAAAYRKLLASYGITGRPVWLTEAGIRLEAADGELAREDERRQAAFVPKSIVMSLASGTDRHFFFVLPWYLERGIQFGALHRDLSPRPAFIAIAAAAEILGAARYRGRLGAADAPFQAHVFDRGDGRVLAGWSERGAEIEVPIEGETARLADLLGRRSEIPAPGGKARVRLDPSPVYVLNVDPEIRLEGRPHAPGTLPRNRPSPIVLVGRALGLPPDKNANAYRVNGSAFTFRVDAYAFSERECGRGEIRVAVPEGWTCEPPVAAVELSPMGRRSLTFRIEPGAPAAGRLRVRVTAAFPGRRPAPSVSHFLWKR